MPTSPFGQAIDAADADGAPHGLRSVALSEGRPPGYDGSPAAYAQLRQAVIDAGLFERRYGYYLLRGIVAFSMLAVALALPFLLPDGWGWAALASLAIGFTTIQAGIIGHDAGHLAVCRRERTNAMIGHVCLNLLLGVSFSFWRTRHNRHHTQTNDQESDPDLEMGGLFTLNEADAASHRGWRRLVTRYQAYLFVPVVMFVLDLAFRTEGWRHVLRDLRGRRQFIEAALLVLSAVLWATPLFFLGWRWLAIYVGAQWVGNLYLNLVFATNHKGMPTWTSGLPLTFLERQVLSSCNVRPSRAVDYLFNGLNYQIEHHLFPTMPRVNFARARAIIRPFCAEHGLPYEELGVVAAYRQVFQTLDRCGRATRTNVAA